MAIHNIFFSKVAIMVVLYNLMGKKSQDFFFFLPVYILERYSNCWGKKNYVKHVISVKTMIFAWIQEIMDNFLINFPYILNQMVVLGKSYQPFMKEM